MAKNFLKISNDAANNQAASKIAQIAFISNFGIDLSQKSGHEKIRN
jgi:hypothetical protein